MSLMKKLSLQVKARAEKALERLEDPRETLEYSYQQLLEVLAKVQRVVADIAASRAAAAVQMENLSKEREQEEQLAVACEHLTAKIEAFRARMETVKASFGAAEGQQRTAGVSQRVSAEAYEQLRRSIEEIAAAREGFVQQVNSLRQQDQAGHASAREAEINRQLFDLVAHCGSLQEVEYDTAMVCERLATKLRATQQEEGVQDPDTSGEIQRQPGDQEPRIPESAEKGSIPELSNDSSGVASTRATDEMVARKPGFWRRRAAPEPAILNPLLGLVAMPGILAEVSGLTPTGVCSICFRAIETRGFRDVQSDVCDRLTQDADNAPLVEVTDDSYGYTWVVIRRTPDSFQSLIHQAYTAGSMFAEGGFGPNLLCSVTPFRDGRDRNVAMVYLYQRGTFYPFAPQAEELRDTELELGIKDVLQGRLPIEADLRRWYAVWGAPGL
jgi:phage shock protein A